MIRSARPDDIGRILELSERFFRESGWSRVGTFDPMSVVETAERLDGDGVLLVSENDGVVTGIAGAAVYPAFFNSAERMSQELIWYVEPGRRGEGMALLKGLEAGCVERGAAVHLMGAVAGDEKFDRFYRARGYHAAERFFVKRLAPW